jgi:integrase
VVKLNGIFNYIKEAAALTGLTERGRLTSDLGKPLNECISSHTARRSFATNLYLDGFPVIDIMKITGHKTEAAFLGYIKVSKLDTAKRLSRHHKLRTAEKAKAMYVA